MPTVEAVASSVAQDVSDTLSKITRAIDGQVWWLVLMLDALTGFHVIRQSGANTDIGNVEKLWEPHAARCAIDKYGFLTRRTVGSP